MPTVAELKVLVGADTSQLEAGLRRADGAVRQFASAVQATGGRVSALFGSLGTAAGVFAGIMATKVVGAAASMLEGLVRMGIGGNAALEQARAGFTTLLGSAEKADAFLRQLADFARRTPFTMESSIEGARNLMAMGFAAKDVIPWLQTIGNVSAALGGSSDTYFRIAFALGQIQARGKLAGQEILQLANAGVNVNEIFEVMSKQTGKSVAELKQMQDQGKITAAMFLQAFQTWANTRFGDAMAQQAQTFSGALSNLMDTLRLLLIDVSEPLFQALKKVVSALTDLVNTDAALRFARTIKEGFQLAVNTVMDLGTHLVTWVRQHITFEDIVRVFRGVVVSLRAGWEILKAVVSTFAQVVVTTVRSIVHAFEPAANEARRAFTQMAQGAGQSGHTFAWWAGYVTGAVVVVIKAFGGLATAVAQMLGSVLRIVVSVGTLIAKALVLFLSPFARHSPSLVEQVEMGVEQIAASWQSLPELIQGPLVQVTLFLQAVGEQAGKLAATVAGSIGDVQRAAMTFSLQLGSVGSTIESFQSYFERTSALAGQVGQSLFDVTKEAQSLWDDFRSGSLSLEEARKRFESIQQRLEQLGMPIDTVKRAFEELSKAIQEQIRAIDEQISALKQRIEDLAKAPIAGEGQLREQIDVLQRQKELVDAAIAAMESGTPGRPIAEIMRDLESARQRLASASNEDQRKEAAAEVERLTQELQQAQQAAWNSKPVQQYIETVQKALEQVNSALQQAIASGASPEEIKRLEALKQAYEEALGLAKEDYGTLVERSESLNKQIRATQALSDATFGAMHEAAKEMAEDPAVEQPFGAIVTGIVKARQEIEQLTAKRAELVEFGSKVDAMARSFNGATENVQTLVDRLDQVIPKLDMAAAHGRDLADDLDAAANGAGDFQEKLNEAHDTLVNYQAIMDEFNRGFQQAQEQLNSISSTIADISGGVKSIAETLDRWSQRIDEITAKLGNLFGDDWTTRVSAWVSGLWGSITGFFAEKLTEAAQIGNDIATSIGNGIAAMKDELVRDVDAFFSGIADWIDQNVATLQAWGQQVGNTIAGAFGSLRGTVTQKANDFFTGIQDWVAANIQTLTTWGDTVATPILERVASLRATMQGKAGELLSGIGDWVNQNWNTIVGWGETIVKAINQGLANIAISWPHIPLPHITVSWKPIDLPGGLSVSVPDFGIQWYARGGIAVEPSVVGIGEAGPEAIVPLDQRGVAILADALGKAIEQLSGSSAGTAQPVVVNVTLDQQVIQRVVVDTMRTEIRTVR